MIQIYFAEARMACNKGHYSRSKTKRLDVEGELSYNLVRYEFDSSRCKSRPAFDSCIFQPLTIDLVPSRGN